MKSPASRRRLPALTASLGCLAVAAWAIPGLADLVTYSRDAIAGGEVWRFFSGHFAHWTLGHIAWDLAVFCVLGAVLESRSRLLFVNVCGLSAAAISIVLWLAQPDLATYRGLSGIDSALFVAAASVLLQEAHLADRPAGALGPLTAVIGLTAKSVYELATGHTLFVASESAFVPVPLAHVTGIATGVIVVAGWLAWKRYSGVRAAAIATSPGSTAIATSLSSTR